MAVSVSFCHPRSLTLYALTAIPAILLGLPLLLVAGGASALFSAAFGPAGRQVQWVFMMVVGFCSTASIGYWGCRVTRASGDAQIRHPRSKRSSPQVSAREVRGPTSATAPFA